MHVISWIKNNFFLKGLARESSQTLRNSGFKTPNLHSSSIVLLQFPFFFRFILFHSSSIILQFTFFNFLSSCSIFVLYFLTHILVRFLGLQNKKWVGHIHLQPWVGHQAWLNHRWFVTVALTHLWQLPGLIKT